MPKNPEAPVIPDGVAYSDEAATSFLVYVKGLLT
jgi:hypothetical protein